MSYPNWLLWLGGTVLPLALLWLLWRLALRPERCYDYNRALLLLAPAVAAALPLLPRPALPAWLAGNAPATQAAAVVLPELPIGATATHAAAVLAGWPWLLALYLVGVAVGLGLLAWQVLRLHQLAQELPRFEYADYTLVQTGGQLPTSTFGRVVFWDETNALAPAEVQAILAHELAHVRQRHTYDVLWLQLWRLVLWPNPVVHLLLPALRLTHELLADQAAAASATPAQPYAPLLARLAAQRLAGRPGSFSLLQPFAFSSTLTRIAMLKNRFPVRRWKQWLVLPVLGGVWLAACQVTVAQTISAAPAPPIPSGPADQQVEIRRLTRAAMRRDSLRGPISPDSTLYVMIRYPSGSNSLAVQVRRVKKGELVRPDGTMGMAPKPAPIRPGVYTLAEQMPALPGGGGMAAIVKAIQDRLVYPAGGTASGRVFVSFVVNQDGSVSDVTLKKGLAQVYDEAVLKAVRELPRFEPGRQNGQAVAIEFTVPVLFAPNP